MYLLPLLSWAFTSMTPLVQIRRGLVVPQPAGQHLQPIMFSYTSAREMLELVNLAEIIEIIHSAK